MKEKKKVMSLLGQIVEIMGQEGFLTEETIEPEDLPSGWDKFLHVYHAEKAQFDPSQPAALRMEVNINNFYGTIITGDAVKMMVDPRDGKPVREIHEGEFFPDGEATLFDFLRHLS